MTTNDARPAPPRECPYCGSEVACHHWTGRGWFNNRLRHTPTRGRERPDADSTAGGTIAHHWCSVPPEERTLERCTCCVVRRECPRYLEGIQRIITWGRVEDEEATA